MLTYQLKLQLAVLLISVLLEGSVALPRMLDKVREITEEITDNKKECVHACSRLLPSKISIMIV